MYIGKHRSLWFNKDNLHIAPLFCSYINYRSDATICRTIKFTFCAWQEFYGIIFLQDPSPRCIIYGKNLLYGLPWRLFQNFAKSYPFGDFWPERDVKRVTAIPCGLDVGCHNKIYHQCWKNRAKGDRTVNLIHIYFQNVNIFLSAMQNKYQLRVLIYRCISTILDLFFAYWLPVYISSTCVSFVWYVIFADIYLCYKTKT